MGRRWPRIPLLIALVGIAALAFLTGVVQAAQAGDDQDWRGIVVSMPQGGFQGEWVIGGRTFVADAGTDFSQEDAPLTVGGCAHVDFVMEGQVARALEIKGKALIECNEDGSATPTPDDTPGTPEPSATPSETPEPSATPSGTPGPTTTPSATPTRDDDDHDGELKLYGFIEAMPDSGLIGQWTVNGVLLETTASTEFEQDYGAFAVGVCVEVEYRQVNGINQVEKLETEHSYKCQGQGNDDNPGDDRHHGELYGLLQVFPPGLIGEWVIGGITFVADQNTEFKQEGGPFAVGVTVKVEFVTDSNNVHHATEIKVKFRNEDDGEDRDGDGEREGAEGQAYGLIELFPPGLQGTWVIGGIEYTATGSTEFKQEHGLFGLGVRVRVEYFVDSSGGRVATEIKVTDDNGNTQDPTHFKLVGFVQEMPTASFIGQWRIGNTLFVADGATQFKEDHGLLAIGAYVEVEYTVSGGENRIHEIETQVPPGAGDNNRLGVIQEMRAAAAAAVDAQASQIWRIDGVDYVITASTRLSDSQGELAVGSSAVVNSYTADDGQEVATRVASINLDHQIFLPAVGR
ncbi:DUF5666 domain-containing protein [Litorilinea aerophila]|uniref:DUF5666 domain-containing protein n=1 Tax=Litorilinea aerophila TaxID=1204385 RepID=A0A540VKU4_9CHLR|nr:DUF5666 domain-containing protein [Litorilinea aerophila]MCC9075073.1 DUF5666 domain-containing protein [Litorilinea aerophila]OUC06037.1 hypothetical protein RY27_23500 [Litorilinea aerophila]